MKKTILHQTIVSAGNFALPYILLFLGFNDWHQNYTEIIVLALFGKSIFYNSYTSNIIEGNKENEFFLIKYLLGIIIISCFYIYFKLNNYIYLFFIFSSFYFEHSRRIRLYYNNFKFLNIIIILNLVLLIISGFNDDLLLISCFVYIIFDLNSLNKKGLKINFTDILNRKWYILTAILSFTIGGGYLLEASKILSPDSFAELRYMLLIFIPGSFIMQIAELLWFKEKIKSPRRLLAIYALILNTTSVIILVLFLSYFFPNNIDLLVVLGLVNLFIGLNSILRLYIRQNEFYGILLTVLVFGSIPYISLRFFNLINLNVIYQLMLVSQILMFLIMFTYLGTKKNNLFLEKIQLWTGKKK